MSDEGAEGGEEGEGGFDVDLARVGGGEAAGFLVLVLRVVVLRPELFRDERSRGGVGPWSSDERVELEPLVVNDDEEDDEGSRGWTLRMALLNYEVRR